MTPPDGLRALYRESRADGPRGTVVAVGTRDSCLALCGALKGPYVVRMAPTDGRAEVAPQLPDEAAGWSGDALVAWLARSAP